MTEVLKLPMLTLDKTYVIETPLPGKPGTQDFIAWSHASRKLHMP